MSDESADDAEVRRPALPRRPVSRPPRLRPTTGPSAARPPSRAATADRAPAVPQGGDSEVAEGDVPDGSGSAREASARGSSAREASARDGAPRAASGSGADERGGPGHVLRALSGSLLAVAAVALGIVVLLAVRGDPGGDTLVAAGEGAAGGPPGAPSPSAESVTDDPVPGDPAPVDPVPTDAAPVEPAPVEPVPAEPAPPPPAVPADVTVTVLAVGGAEEAEPTAQQLRDAGWTVRNVTRYRGSPPGSTTLFHVAGREDAAALLAGQVGATSVQPAPSSLTDSDLTLVVPG